MPINFGSSIYFAIKKAKQMLISKNHQTAMIFKIVYNDFNNDIFEIVLCNIYKDFDEAL